MDVKKLDSLPGMPTGFPFVMILLAIAFTITGGIFHTIEGRFFTSMGNAFGSLGEPLIKWGAVLQVVLWVCAAFGRRTTPPPM